MRKAVLLLVFGLSLCFALPAFAQTGVPWVLGGDPSAPGVVKTQGSGLPFLVAVPNVSLNFCAYPANAVPCTNFATTFTDVTLATACPNNAQIVLQPGNSCVATSDGVGKLGVYTAPGLYQYTLTTNGINYGPFTLNLGGTGAGGGIAVVLGTTNQIDVATGTTTPTLSIHTNPTLPGNVTVSGNLTISGTQITAFAQSITAFVGNGAKIPTASTIAGTSQLICTDSLGNLTLTTSSCPAGGGGGTPGGSSLSLQYNCTGSFCGFGSYNSGTSTLNLANLALSGTETFTGPLTFQSVIPGSPPPLPSTGSSAISIAADGNFCMSNNGGACVDLGLNATNGCVDIRNYLVVPFNSAPETEDFGLALNKALAAVIAQSNPLGTFCVDASMLVPSHTNQLLYGNRLFSNTNFWKGLGSVKNPDVHYPNAVISQSVMLTTPQGGMLTQGVPSSGTVNIGGNISQLGSIISMCNDSGGCGPNAYPQYTTATGCLSGSTNCYPVGGPWASGANALAAAYHTGTIKVQSNANTANCGSPINSGVSNTILCGAAGTPVFAASMIGGVVAYNCTANTCTEGSTSAYSLSRIVNFVAHGASFPTGGGTCTEASGTGGCLITEAAVQGGTNLVSQYLLYSPNLPVLVCDGCTGNAINNFTFAHVWRDIALDVNGVAGGLGYLGPSVQERTSFDDFLVQLQGQQIVNNAATSGCMSFGGAPTTTVVATHWNTAGVIGCSANTNATSAVAGGTYGEVIEGHNQIKGTDNGCPTFHDFGTIVGQAASKFYDAAWVDGCSYTGGVYVGPHAEYYANDAINVGALHPVFGALFLQANVANNTSANAVIELNTGTASNLALSTSCSAAGAPPVLDDTLTTPETWHCGGGGNATSTLPRYQQAGSAGNSFPMSFAATPMKLTGLTADQALTTIYTTRSAGSMGGAGSYRVCYSAYTTTAGTANTATVQVQWNDGNAKTFTSASWALGATDVTGQVNGCQIIHAAVSSAIKVGTANGTYGTSVYALEATVEQLQGTP